MELKGIKMQFTRDKFQSKAKLEKDLECKLTTQGEYMRESGWKIKELEWGLKYIKMEIVIRVIF